MVPQPCSSHSAWPQPKHVWCEHHTQQSWSPQTAYCLPVLAATTAFLGLVFNLPNLMGHAMLVMPGMVAKALGLVALATKVQHNVQRCWQPHGFSLHDAGCELEAAPLLAAAMLIMLCMVSGDMLDIMLVAI